LENTDRQDELSKETLHVSYLNIHNNVLKDNDESLTEDDEEVVDKNDVECNDSNKRKIIQTRSE